MPAARKTPRIAASKTLALVLAAMAMVSACSANPQQTTQPARRVVSDRPVSSASSATPRATPPPIGIAGSYRVGERPMTFTEPAHSGPSGQYVGPRQLVTEISYPLAPSSASAPAAGPYPLLVFGPGFMLCAGPYSHLLQTWASAGYVVAAVNFPRTNCHVAAPNEADLVNQPADMSYVIKRMLELGAQPYGLLSGLVNPGKIGAAGQSDGGDTVAALAANMCCMDRRVEAVAVLSGAEWPAMPGPYFAHGSPPMLFVQGSADTVNQPWTSLELYRDDLLQARYYLDLFGADHLGPYLYSSPVEHLVAKVTLAFFDWYLLGQRGAAATMKRDGNVRGIAALVSGGHLPP